MRIKLINLFKVVAVSGGLMAGQPLFADQPVDFTKSLAGISAMEMPATAVSILEKASAADRQMVAVAVIKAAVGLKPTAAVAIVSAMARDNASIAPIAAVTAATMEHKQLKMITKAAVAAAPSEAAKIVAALIKEFPTDYGLIAMAAAEEAPGASRGILAVVGDSVPSLKVSIQSVLASAGNANVSVSQTILNPPDTQPAAPLFLALPDPSPSLSGPTTGSPYQSVPSNAKMYGASNTVTEGSRTNGGSFAGTGGGYASP